MRSSRFVHELDNVARPLTPAHFFDGTGGRTRTDTSSRIQDFESSASTNFTTPAFLKEGSLDS